VEASNSYARILIFGSFSFIVFFAEVFSSFYSPLFTFLWLSVLLSFLLLSGFFIALRFPPSFSPLFYLCFSAYVVSSLAYPNLLETKRLGCCCCGSTSSIYSGMHIRRSQVVYSVVLNPDNVSSLLILDLEVLKVETLKSLILT
jgi:hypothetical protein